MHRNLLPTHPNHPHRFVVDSPHPETLKYKIKRQCPEVQKREAQIHRGFIKNRERSVLYPQRTVQGLSELLLSDSIFIKFLVQREKDPASQERTSKPEALLGVQPEIK